MTTQEQDGRVMAAIVICHANCDKMTSVILDLLRAELHVDRVEAEELYKMAQRVA